jgi:hypothetical protein
VYPDFFADNTITFACYESHSFCQKHLTLPGAPTKCHHCALLPEKERGKFIRKKQLTKKVKPVGVFMKDYFVPMMERARYHHQKVILLSTNHCGKDRREHWPSVDGCIFTQHDGVKIDFGLMNFSSGVLNVSTDLRIFT